MAGQLVGVGNVWCRDGDVVEDPAPVVASSFTLSAFGNVVQLRTSVIEQGKCTSKTKDCMLFQCQNLEGCTLVDYAIRDVLFGTLEFSLIQLM